MRVCFKREDGRVTVVEVIQMIRYCNTDAVGLVLPYTKYGETKNYDHYESTTPADEHEFSYWCDQLMRGGYLDLTRSNLVFKAYEAKN